MPTVLIKNIERELNHVFDIEIYIDMQGLIEITIAYINIYFSILPLKCKTRFTLDRKAKFPTLCGVVSLGTSRPDKDSTYICLC